MKIRTRLLLFLLPPLIFGIALIAGLFIVHLLGYSAQELSPALIEEKFRAGIFVLLAGSGVAIFTMVCVLYWVANKISKPVQKLNNSALAIAAGQYGGFIEAQGPKEIAELANTLNTMSECLQENINRLQENSKQRARMYGEYECSILLQHLMLQKNIDQCRSDAIAVKPITAFSETPTGLLLDFPKSDNSRYIQIHMAEADEMGLEGMYQLLTRYRYAKESATRTFLVLDRSQSVLRWEGPQTPLIWSLRNMDWLTGEEKTLSVEPGDFFFLFNEGFSAFYRHPKKIADFLARVLKIFAQEGLETTAAMLQKEIGFSLRRKDLDADLHLLCFQILSG